MNKPSSPRPPKAMSKNEQTKRLIGLEGWLALFIVGIFLSLVLTIFNFFYEASIDSSDFNALNEYQAGLGDNLRVIVAIEDIAIVLYIAMAVTTLVLLFQRQRLAKPFAIATLSFAAIYTTADYLIVYPIFNEAGLLQDEHTRVAIQDAAESAGRNLFGAAVWIPYFLASKRVARTLQGSSTETGTNHRRDSTDITRPSFLSSIVRYIATLTAVLVVACIVVLLSGGSLFETWEKVDREYKPETFRTEHTGKSNISFSGDYICGSGQDYNNCVNQHVAVYNASCANQALTTSAINTCDELLTFINQTKSRLLSCGYGCKTIADSNGLWGWQYLKLTPETQQVSNGDKQEASTHTAVCIVRVGIVKIGECKN